MKLIIALNLIAGLALINAEPIENVYGTVSAGRGIYVNGQKVDPNVSYDGGSTVNKKKNLCSMCFRPCNLICRRTQAAAAWAIVGMRIHLVDDSETLM